VKPYQASWRVGKQGKATQKQLIRKGRMFQESWVDPVVSFASLYTFLGSAIGDHAQPMDAPWDEPVPGERWALQRRRQRKPGLLPLGRRFVANERSRSGLEAAAAGLGGNGGDPIEIVERRKGTSPQRRLGEIFGWLVRVGEAKKKKKARASETVRVGENSQSAYAGQDEALCGKKTGLP